MRFSILIPVIFSAWSPAMAQKSQMELRMDSSMQRIIKAVNNPNKPDPTLGNPLQGKSFEGHDSFALRKSGLENQTFEAGSSTIIKEFTRTRSFLGIKNPWLGKTVYDSSKASLWSKSIVENADKEVPVKSEKTKEFYQSEKTSGERSAPFETTPYLVPGKSQGAMNQMTERVKKEMTIEEVRDLLNKNR